MADSVATLECKQLEDNRILLHFPLQEMIM